MTVKFGIKQKLYLIFFLFFLIFSGTVSLLLFNSQRMVETTERIVSKNNKIEELTEIMLASLLDMEANHKKLNILKKPRYSEYFEEAKNSFETALQHAVSLADPRTQESVILRQFEFSYNRHRTGLWDEGTSPEIGQKWVTDQVVSNWVDSLSRIKRQNQIQIEQSLRELNERSRISGRNGLYGFALSLAVGFVGIWFISRAIFTPLKTLGRGLKRISIDKSYQPIQLKGGEEFTELAAAYNDMSRQLNEEENIRTEFIATLSHEIRTPLSSIHESVNMMVEEVFGAVNEKQAKFLKIASMEIQRINKLLNYLLSVSVLESGSDKKSSDKIAPDHIVHACAELFTSLAEKKNIAVRVEEGPQKPELYGVREELQQVFVNIIGNAVKYSDEGGAVFITWKKDKEKNFLLFSVTDEGPGIPEDEISMVFTKYYRTKTVRGHLDGVGLGLAIAQKIVTGYGGSIFVSNNTPKGCTFSFSLPAR